MKGVKGGKGRGREGKEGERGKGVKEEGESEGEGERRDDPPPCLAVLAALIDVEQLLLSISNVYFVKVICTK